LHKKVNWIGHILGSNCLLHDAIEGEMTEVKEFLDDLINRRRYWEPTEEADDQKR